MRSVGITSCFAVGTLTALFFAGFAPRGKAASTPNEPNVARMQSATAIGGIRGMAAAGPPGGLPFERGVDRAARLFGHSLNV